jgi:hypothetical protein
MYSECYCVASVTKTLTLTVVQTTHSLYSFKCKFFVSPHGNIRNTIVKFFLKHPALPVEVTLNRRYPRQNSVYFAIS